MMSIAKGSGWNETRIDIRAAQGPGYTSFRIAGFTIASRFVGAFPRGGDPAKLLSIIGISRPTSLKQKKGFGPARPIEN